MPNIPSGNICLEVARAMMREYTSASDALMRDHHEAMDAWKCQDHLQSGIDTYYWISQAERFLQEADHRGLFEFTPEHQEAVFFLYKAWLEPCENAEKWIESVRSLGYAVDNLEKFRAICNDVQDKIQHLEMIQMSTDALNHAYLSDSE